MHPKPVYGGGCLIISTFRVCLGMCLATKEESLNVARELEARVSQLLCGGCVQFDVSRVK